MANDSNPITLNYNKEDMFTSNYRKVLHMMAIN